MSDTPRTRAKEEEIEAALDHPKADLTVAVAMWKNFASLLEREMRQGGPSGGDYVLVPRNPTKEMILAGQQVFLLFVHTGCVGPIWRTMIGIHEGKHIEDFIGPPPATTGRLTKEKPCS